VLKLLSVLFIWLSISHALTFNELSSQPKSIEKDFYIYLYLLNHDSPYEAKELYKQVKHLNGKLKREFKKYGLTQTPKSTQKKPEEAYDLDKLSNLPPNKFLEIFNSLSSWHIGKYLNKPLKKEYVKKLANYNGFNRFTKLILKSKADKLKASILDIKSNKTKAESSFYMALANLNNKSLSIHYLKLARKNAVSDFKKNRATFWLYLVTKDKKYLKELGKSKELNIYSLYAYENLNKSFNNIVTEFKITQITPPFDYKNPFAWVRTKKKAYRHLKNLHSNKQKRRWLKNHYASKETFSHLAYLLRDYDKKNYFLFPYKTYIKDLPKKRQALILAIAKQESQFVPTAVSPSFALGMMQFMPFLAKHTAKKLGIKNFSYDDMFDPKIAYLFANDHLNYLEKHLFHPLLIAYAYNGGIGYTKRNIFKKNFFKKGKYEPFYSLEMIKPEQPMHYAKKVLANYVVYCNLLGFDITITQMLEKLKDISSNHGF
jgi:soluble lytic murein transglycosylase